MKTINLFFDFEFTSLSPDAQPISLGIVSDEIFDKQYAKFYKSNKPITAKEASIDHCTTKSFYAEFSDFDINRCDEWVKKNVVGKLKYYNNPEFLDIQNSTEKLNRMGLYFGENNELGIHFGTTEGVKINLNNWLSQFSDYNIQFVCDCGTFDWYHLLQLIGTWNETIKSSSEGYYWHNKFGLPLLSDNISPVPQDLNDLILLKYLRKVVPHATPLDAFNASRVTLMYLLDDKMQNNDMYEVVNNVFTVKNNEHNSLWDAKVIKAIFNKLK